jgi:hypothetical protein
MFAKRIGAVVAALGATAGLMFGVAGSASAAPATNNMWECMPQEGAAYGNWCTTTTTSVNVRFSPTQFSNSAGVEPKGAPVIIMCWAAGESIYGDNIWYMTTNYNGVMSPGGDPSPQGYVTGYYLNTGHDPNGAISQCNFGAAKSTAKR